MMFDPPFSLSQQDFNERLALALADDHRIDARALERAVIVAKHEATRLDQVLTRLGLLDEDILLPATCAVLRTECIRSASGIEINDTALRTLTSGYCQARIIAPFMSASDALSVATPDPANTELAAELAFLLGGAVHLVGATTAVVRALLGRGSTDEGSEEALRAVQASRDRDRLREAEIEGPVIRYVQEKLADAVLQNASDIHFESHEQGVAIRFRIHGVLIPQRTDPTLPAAQILARLKVMAGLNVAERRLPQDGRFTATIAGRTIDFRFSSLPTAWGESVVCRVLDPKALRLGWTVLGFDPDMTRSVQAIIEQPSGLFLVTGPTGSGKTTTLYTAITHLNTAGRKIVTVEDPVEYNLPGVQQVQVHEAIGLTFARVLRSVLRHDPNVILVGEIRDEETAEIAVRAAQVGRMVLSTLHANSAEGAMPRLVDLGVPEFLVRDVLRGVLAQDLVSVWCTRCNDTGCPDCAASPRDGAPSARALRAVLYAPG